MNLNPERSQMQQGKAISGESCMGHAAVEVADYLSEARRVLSVLSQKDIVRAVHVLYQIWLGGNKVILLGNGGSAATASHFACDLNKGCAVAGKRRLCAIALTDSIPLMTAWGNDADPKNVFAEQLPNYLEPGDVVVAISGSGNSANVIRAVEVAKANGAFTLGFSGFSGGKLRSLVDHCVVVPCECMEQIEDMHVVLMHCICSVLRLRIGSSTGAEEDHFAFEDLTAT